MAPSTNPSEVVAHARSPASTRRRLGSESFCSASVHCFKATAIGPSSLSPGFQWRELLTFDFLCHAVHQREPPDLRGSPQKVHGDVEDVALRVVL